ncbi:MAG: hypothetical protein OSA82_04905, partial [Paracoccaceae bacterium]|nr:hypothetical protein [Paracoccaceae bacterium]
PHVRAVFRKTAPIFARICRALTDNRLCRFAGIRLARNSTIHAGEAVVRQAWPERLARTIGQIYRADIRPNL